MGGHLPSLVSGFMDLLPERQRGSTKLAFWGYQRTGAELAGGSKHPLGTTSQSSSVSGFLGPESPCAVIFSARVRHPNYPLSLSRKLNHQGLTLDLILTRVILLLVKLRQQQAMIRRLLSHTVLSPDLHTGSGPGSVHLQQVQINKKIPRLVSRSRVPLVDATVVLVPLRCL